MLSPVVFELSAGSAQPMGHTWGPCWIRDKFQGAFSRRPLHMVDRRRVKYSLQALLWVQGLVCRLELGEVEMGADLSEQDLRPLLVYLRHRVPRAVSSCNP